MIHPDGLFELLMAVWPAIDEKTERVEVSIEKSDGTVEVIGVMSPERAQRELLESIPTERMPRA